MAKAINIEHNEFEKSLSEALQSGSPVPPPGFVKSFRSSVASLSEDIEHVDLEPYHIDVKKVNVLRNPAVAILYEEALTYETGTSISETGALMCSSGERTGRSPKDKRIVKDANTEGIWWGRVNIALDDHTFMINRERAVDYLSTRQRLYVIDAYAGWVTNYRLKVRVICARAYHALFMKNMLIRPTRDELRTFGKPDFIIYNAGQFPANRYTQGMTSSCSVSINFTRNEMVILGTQYAGEMKKGIFSVMHYYMPKMGVLSLHSSANVGVNGDVSIFFGLSGTGKTTLSADPDRRLIGDDETCWYDNGVFNIEGGCYAKCIGLSREQEPEIYDAVRFGSVLENVVFDPSTRVINYNDDSITQNTRTSYPIEFIPNALIPCVSGHPKNIIMLSCDAFGVLPPVAKLTIDQAMYYFISGYTAKVAGTEVGIDEPEATFSACFGDAFLVWHPTRYAEMLAEKVHAHAVSVWLVSTGWSGGPYGVGSRIKLRYTRAIIDAIHNGELANAECETIPYFNLKIPTKCTNVPTEILNPRNTWKSKEQYDAKLKYLAQLFQKNFSEFTDERSKQIATAGPQL